MKKILLYVLSSLFILCSCGGNSQSSSYKSGKPYIKEECLSATTENAFSKMNRICNQKDEVALQQMILDGDVFVLKTYYTISMENYGVAKCKIKVDDINTSVYISTEFIDYK